MHFTCSGSCPQTAALSKTSSPSGRTLSGVRTQCMTETSGDLHGFPGVLPSSPSLTALQLSVGHTRPGPRNPEGKR